MSKHTPRPWGVGNRHTMLGVFTPDGKMIANTHSATRNRDMESLIAEQDANARLIAAARDLLEALEMVRDADNDRKSDGFPTISPIARAKIDAAIAKAKGSDDAAR